MKSPEMSTPRPDRYSTLKPRLAVSRSGNRTFFHGRPNKATRAGRPNGMAASGAGFVFLAAGGFAFAVDVLISAPVPPGGATPLMPARLGLAGIVVVVFCANRQDHADFGESESCKRVEFSSAC
ncbi:MAG: hypothetical protein KGS61_15095 [Verrucomicrobia bacterium]|nr:hypothetical protein [Verrucomicrobiota bacterium]